MYQDICKKLAVDNSLSEVSQPVTMEGHNTVRINIVVFTGTVLPALEKSNDLENWTSHGAAFSAVTGPAYRLLDARSTKAAYVRVKWTHQGKGAAIVAGGVNMSKQ